MISRPLYTRSLAYLATVWFLGALAFGLAAGISTEFTLSLAIALSGSAIANGSLAWLHLYINDSASPSYLHVLQWLWWPYDQLHTLLPSSYTGVGVRLLIFILLFSMDNWFEVATSDAAPVQLGLGFIGSESASALYMFLKMAHEQEVAECYQQGVDYSTTVEVDPAAASTPTEQPTVLQVDEQEQFEQLRQLLLLITDRSVQECSCNCCASTHPFLARYPFDPDLHDPGCPLPIVRRMIDPNVAHCPKYTARV